MIAEAQGELDVSHLENYLRSGLTAFKGPITLERFQGGQSNPTYRLTCADGQRYVLRKKPAGNLLPSAHAIEREFHVTQALHSVGFPVANPRLLCEDESIIGTAFYVMDLVDGRVLRDPALPGMEQAQRHAIWDELNRVIAQLHSIDHQTIGLADYGKTGNFLSRQISRWSRQYRASETDRIEAMDRLINWLPNNIPPGDETSIVHGDFRLENVILHPSEPQVLAVLDWELSTLGDPLADLAYLALSWHLPRELFSGFAGLDLQSLGIPMERQFVDAYCTRSGRSGIDPATWNYYISYNLFRVAAIMQGIAKRALDGNAASAEADRMGKMARPIAELTWALVEKNIAPAAAS